MEEKIIAFLLNKKLKLVRQIIFLLFFFILLYCSGFYIRFPKEDRIYWFVSVYTFFVIMFYINTYYLVPKFLDRKYLTYFSLLICLVIVTLSIVLLTNRYILHLNTPKGEFFMLQPIYGIFTSISFIMITTTTRLAQNWIIDKEKIIELEKLTYEMELSELKNQINPHFLFNNLNSVKALIQKNPEEAVNTVVKLSEFLRFQLYENRNNKNNLCQEILFLTNYLELEQKRRDDFTIKINNTINSESLNQRLIPSNLFTVFIENAVKHSVDVNDDPSYININFSITNLMLHFECSNSICPDFKISDTKNKGIGLTNIKRRLELLYGDSYELKLNKKEKEFVVTLNLPL